ncbi:MAG TPA: beta-L-arabinofuranosidase domain-containing protein [Fimbriimonadaceae bacterium]|nr:beta-L-arabinofuranosidase domain-containing protein [Fimbriimonadaceae bacterium]
MITFVALALMASDGHQEFAKLEPVTFNQVHIRDRFWQPRQEVNRTATVEHSLQMLENAGNLTNFELVKEGKHTGFKGYVFADSDVYKVMEGIAYTLATHPDPALDKKMDDMIALIAAAQQPNGYIDTSFEIQHPDKEFTNLRDWHEMYCAGHMIEAAVAHFRATGKRNFLNVALKTANLINSRYGPGEQLGYPGHPELELALIKLWKVTGDQKWFDLSAKLIDTRGEHYFAEEHGTPPEQYDGTYWIDDLPISEQADIKGHAVRAAYLMSGAADVARVTEDPALLKMLDRVWRSATQRRVYITGGIGPSNSNEGFTVDYDLPNLTAYQETCASVAMALWGHRMALLYGDAKYMDAVEKSLYNGVISGVSLDGKSFFYVNPLASMGNHARSPWFACACCPPNVLRTIASLGGYIYATSDDSLYVNLFVGGDMYATVGRKKVAMDVATDYPWSGKVTYTMKGPGQFALRLRDPGWCSGATVSVNGRKVDAPVERDYFVVDRDWKKGDKVVLDLPMPVVQMEAHPSVKDDRGMAAIQRGPLVYCAEQVDNVTQVDELVVPRGAKTSAKYEKKLLNGVVEVTAEAEKRTTEDWDNTLYQPLKPEEKAVAKFIPYGFWANRGRGKMVVWTPTEQPPARILTTAMKAQVTMSYVSGNAQPWGVNDGVEPASSGEQPKALAHFWPHKGGQEWIQYTWTNPITATGVDVYWFDDTGRGECRIPVSWKIQALTNGEWKDLKADAYPVAKDKWCTAKFDKVTTTALRLVVTQQDGWASGVHEWKVTTAADD